MAKKLGELIPKIPSAEDGLTDVVPAYSTIVAEASVATEVPLRQPSKRTKRNLIRKEAFIWKKQRDALTLIARRRDEYRTVDQPRITENTIIRIGIDLVIQRADELRGSTEEELRRSLGL